jgi:hypothetical protein
MEDKSANQLPEWNEKNKVKTLIYIHIISQWIQSLKWRKIIK